MYPKTMDLNYFPLSQTRANYQKYSRTFSWLELFKKNELKSLTEQLTNIYTLNYYILIRKLEKRYEYANTGEGKRGNKSQNWTKQ